MSDYSIMSSDDGVYLKATFNESYGYINSSSGYISKLVGFVILH